MAPSVSPFRTTCVTLDPLRDEPHFSTDGSGTSNAPATTADDGRSTTSPAGRRPRLLGLSARLYQPSVRTDTPARCAMLVSVSPFFTCDRVSAERSACARLA